jgi:hypothetical protein
MTRPLRHFLGLSTPRSARVLGLALVLAVLGASCSVGDTALTGKNMSIRMISGSANLVHGKKSTRIGSSAALSPGDQIVMGRTALAEVRLAKGLVFELSGADALVTGASALKLTRGELLADVTAPAKIDAESVVVTASRASFRVDRALATRVGVYAGSVVATRMLDKLKIPSLRQTIVAAGILPRAPKPLRISPIDRWDRRFLQEAIDLDGRLSNFGRGLEAQLGAGSGLPFFQQIMPLGLDLSFLSSYLTNRRSDLLIGLTLANGIGKDPSTFSAGFEKIFTLWSDGATWGLIAYEFKIEPTNIFDNLLSAVQKAGLAVGPSGFATGTFGRVRPGAGTAVGGGGRNSSPGRAPSSSPSKTTSNSPSTPNPTETSKTADECVISNLTTGSAAGCTSSPPPTIPGTTLPGGSGTKSAGGPIGLPLP